MAGEHSGQRENTLRWSFATAQEAAKAVTEYARQLYANFYIPSFHDQEAAK